MEMENREWDKICALHGIFVIARNPRLSALSA